MNVQMDFLSDWQNIMIEEIKEVGLSYSPATFTDSLIIKYFTYQRKKGGSPRPRRVHMSNRFSYPPELENGLKRLIDTLKKGEDISPYFSKQVDKISSIDGMFNDWGVLHLHLGDGIDPANGRYVTRTGPLLFLYLHEEDAYLINVYEHGDWTDRSVLQTAFDNWPELIEPYVLKGAIGLSPPYTEEDHARLRAAGLNVAMELKDNEGNTFVIAPPGFGQTASRDAFADVRAYHQSINTIRAIERDLLEKPQSFETLFGGNKPESVRLKLIRDNDKFYIIEQSTNTKLYKLT